MMHMAQIERGVKISVVHSKEEDLRNHFLTDCHSHFGAYLMSVSSYNV